jgi:hypothetical protein
MPLTLTAEPTVAGILRYLPLAPSTKGEQEQSQINLVLNISNAGPDPVRVKKITLSVPGSRTIEMPFPLGLNLPAGENGHWTQPDDYVVVMPSPPTEFRREGFARKADTFSAVEHASLRIQLEGDGIDAGTEFTLAMAPHVSPAPGGCYRFWARADDLRPDEFWDIDGTKHQQTNPAQLFAYDVNVAARDLEGPAAPNRLLPGTDGSKNEHYRIWGKPIRAVADGEVLDFRNDYPTNCVPGQIDLLSQDYWAGSEIVDGNGNFFSISGGDETVLYAHMQPGSLNRALLHKTAVVKAGDFLGLAGNSGASSNPHMHIHSVARGSGDLPWTGAPRPMLFKDLQAVAYTAIPGNVSLAPWAAIQNRGFPFGKCAVWPLSTVPAARAICLLSHFALSKEGQLWVILGDGSLRTTAARMPCRGAFMDYDPTGVAQDIVVSGTKPYVIGSDQHVSEGRSNGWFPLPSSPLCIRLAIDPAYGGLWALSTDRRIFRYPGLGTWIEPDGQGRGKDLCISAGRPHVIGDDDHIWELFGDDDPSSKQIGAANHPFPQIGAADHTLKPLSPRGWQPLPGNQTAMRLASDTSNGHLWVLTSKGEVLRYKGDGNWSTLPEVPGTDAHNQKISSQLVVLDGWPYVIGPDRHLWVASSGFGWQQVLTTKTYNY